LLLTAYQARAFLVSYHAIRLTKSARLVEEEQWTQIDISRSIQHTVNLLIDSAVADPPECAIPPPPSPHTNGDAEEPAKVLKVEEKTFYLVKATAESLGLLRDYLSIVINLELVVTDVMSRIIEFLKVRVLPHRVRCLLIDHSLSIQGPARWSLGPGRCDLPDSRTSLQSILVGHLLVRHPESSSVPSALASQSLSVIVSLIPYIREFIRRHLNLKQAVMLTEFDKLKRVSRVALSFSRVLGLLLW